MGKVWNGVTENHRAERRRLGSATKVSLQSPTPHSLGQGRVGVWLSVWCRTSIQLAITLLTAVASSFLGTRVLLGRIQGLCRDLSKPPLVSRAICSPSPALGQIPAWALCLARGLQGAVEGGHSSPHSLGAAETALSLMMQGREKNLA